ncbi:hypothetical protein FGG08_007490 [Glutinoglossum americanum]|uniref:Heterokaryon incompatibility domain-containing protein n=1 Tax=Glutinoglossum americanum TaxID=1670608 RepID=A0A9P8KWD1_9PEZI|nr:hypothetical protein FGG08_007490 [Glutinoglossum americanum]
MFPEPDGIHDPTTRPALSPQAQAAAPRRGQPPKPTAKFRKYGEHLKRALAAVKPSQSRPVLNATTPTTTDAQTDLNTLLQKSVSIIERLGQGIKTLVNVLARMEEKGREDNEIIAKLKQDCATIKDEQEALLQQTQEIRSQNQKSEEESVAVRWERENQGKKAQTRAEAPLDLTNQNKTPPLDRVNQQPLSGINLDLTGISNPQFNTGNPGEIRESVRDRKIYEYEPLSSPDLLRLLTLEPGNEADSIKCPLRTASMSDYPSYEALSYVWGDSKKSHSIICDEALLGITEAVHIALRRLRQTTRARTLWIDQTCINQVDPQEQAGQVQMMRQIYSNALLVILWLGKDDGNMAFLTKELVAKLKNAYGREDPQWKLFPRDSSLQELGLPPSASPEWEALEFLINLPFFRRIWILQEVTAAHKALIVWGEVEISWDDFATAALWAILNCLHLSSEERSSEVPRLSLWRLSVFLFSLQPRPWLKLLRETRDFEATDPRDTVYALIGMAKESPPIRANYLITKEEMFASTTRHIMESSKCLDILSYAYCGTQPLLHMVPFWVYRRTKAHTDKPWTLSPEVGLQASKDSYTQLKDGSDWRVLIVNGLAVDTVACTGKPLCHESISFDWLAKLPQTFDMCRENASKLNENYGRSLIQCFISTVVAGSMDSQDCPKFGANQEDVLKDFVTFVVTKFILEYAKEGVVAPVFRHGIIELANLALEGCAQPNEPLAGDEPTPTIRNLIKTAMEEQCLGIYEMFTEINDRLFDYWNRRTYMHFQRVFQQTGSKRKFFITEQGRMGIGPPCMEATDLVYLLFGGRSLYVLRPTTNLDGHLFLGECYVHGLMSGEVMQQYKKGEFSSQYFHLR